MYLHLGQSVVVPFRDVIGIFDLDTTTDSRITREFLKRAEREGELVDVSMDLPKSLCSAGRSWAPSPTSPSSPPPPSGAGWRAGRLNRKNHGGADKSAPYFGKECIYALRQHTQEVLQCLKNWK